MKVTSDDLIEALKAGVSKTSQKDMAENLGVTPQFLNDVLRGRREISYRLAEAMGFRRLVLFERISKAKKTA